MSEFQSGVPERATGKSPEPADRNVRPTWITAALLIACIAILLWRGVPGIDAGTAALQPKNSPAYAALDMMKTRLGQTQEPLFVVIAGRSESEVADQLDRIEPTLATAVSNQTLASYTLPVALWAHPANQQSNSIAARKLISQRDTLRDAALAGGFSQDALGLSDTVLDTWQRAATGPQPFWPTNAFCTWILDKLVARDGPELHAVGILFPTTNATPARLAALESEIRGQRSEVRDQNTQHATRNTETVWLSGWGLLGDAVLSVVKSNLWKLVVPMVSLVLLSLGFAFRRPAEILLSLGSLLLSGLILLSVMSLANWSWNVLNLMALPLILGTGVDYGIFMQLALRRYNGDLELTRRAVGRALLLCGATAIAGFGALGFSSNAGMASLGRVCAVGIAGNMLIAVYLLPAWWKLVGQASRLSGGGNNREPGQPLEGDAHRTGKMPVPLPSSLYRARLWTLGVKLCGVLPHGFCNFIARSLAFIYCRIASHRRHIVKENLLPLLDGDRVAARRTAPKLFAAFATKLVDLLRYESGAPIGKRITSWNGWEHFQSAAAQNRGVLLVTPHLGNWEFGGPFLTERGHKLLVLTQAEPDPELTRIRQESRARWGIETLVVGEDMFSFIEIIKRLQAGANVALLIDRPPEVSGVTVEFCGKPFQASIAAAELARASGCALLPVFMVLQRGTYYAQILPEISYDRASLGNRAARTQLTQEIMRALEPAIRQHPEQWFHFVPVWKEGGK